jgi:Cu2+-exporting ATPase
VLVIACPHALGLAIPLESSDCTSSPAVGVTATVDGRQVPVGGPRLLEEAGEHELPEAGAWREEGHRPARPRQ